MATSRSWTADCSQQGLFDNVTRVIKHRAFRSSELAAYATISDAAVLTNRTTARGLCTYNAYNKRCQ